MTILITIAICRILLHLLTNGQYGFHRDELATFDDSRHLAWGYVAYPPFTPFVGRISWELFGASLRGLRFFASLAQGVSLVLTGLMARELGGGRVAQIVAALAVAIAPISLAAGTLFQYVAFDYLWWVWATYLLIRLLHSGEPRLWLGLGVVIGLGVMTKYTIGVLVIAMTLGILLTPERRYLKSKWLWLGAAVAVLISLPNLVWQFQHNFISIEFLRSIHARDIRIGRTDGFLLQQLLIGSSLFTVPLCVAGLFFYFRSADGRKYRLMGWVFVFSLVVFTVARGRGYYMGPVYPVLFAAGAMVWERWVAGLSLTRARVANGIAWAGLAAGGVMAAALTLPIAPVHSAWWNTVGRINGDLKEEIGWPELVQTIAGIWRSLPEGDRARAAILTGNYGEAGAVDLYGGAYGLPKAISGVNSYWLRGYPEPPPETVIVTGLSRKFLDRNFEFCKVAGHVTNPYGVLNEETEDHPDLFVCRGLRRSWAEFWKDLRSFG